VKDREKNENREENHRESERKGFFVCVAIAASLA
jgi:hypothetical protein